MEFYGLDRPAAVQYLAYLKQILTGNLGESLYYNEPVGRILMKR